MNELNDEKIKLANEFALIMEHFKRLFVDNHLLINDYNKPDVEYVQLETDLTTNTNAYKEFTYKLEQSLNSVLQEYKNLNGKVAKIKTINSNLHTKFTELRSFNKASDQMKSDAMFNYSKNNIKIFNYLVGSIFCLYIINNI